MHGCRSLLLTSTCLAAVLAAGAAFAARQPYDRYRTIVDRQMFGPLPDGFDPTKLPSEAARPSKKGAEELSREQEKVKSAIRFSVINVTPDGLVKVGFTDRSDAKNPRNYYLGVGEARDGWLVKDADADKATMTIVRSADSVEVSLSIGGDSAKDASATARAGAANQSSPGAIAKSRLLGGGRRLSRRELQANATKTAEELEQIQRDRQAEREERAKRDREIAEANAQQRQEMLQQLNSLRDELKANREAAAAAEAAKNAEKEGVGDANDDAE